MKITTNKNTFMKLNNKSLLVLSTESDLLIKVEGNLASLVYETCQNGVLPAFDTLKLNYILNSLQEHGFISFDNELTSAHTDELVVTDISSYMSAEDFVPLHGKISATITNCISYCDNCGI